MSRADEERAKYQSEIAQIRNNLLKEVGNSVNSTSMVNDVFTRINKIIEEPEQFSDEEISDEADDEVEISEPSIIQSSC